MEADYYGSLVYPTTNQKTGPIAVITITDETCAEDCPFREESCYARGGPLAIHWRAISRKDKGQSWDDLCCSVSRLPLEIMIRYGQAGDLPGDGVLIDRAALLKMAKAARGRKMFGYTHYDLRLEWNASCVEMAILQGFVINASANNLDHADELKGLGRWPVVTVLPTDYPDRVGFTPAGHRVVVCPAQYQADVTCQSCKLCASPKRESIIGFLAHGFGAKHASSVARGEAA